MDADEGEFRDLLERAKAGDPDAARRLYRTYNGFVRAAVRRKLHPRLRTQYDSLDFAQDVWTSFLTAPDAPRFESPAALVAFLTRVAQNKVVDVFRQRFESEKNDIRREQPVNEKGDPVVGRYPTPSQWAIAGERWEELLRTVPPAYRGILERLRAGYTLPEIARDAGVSLSTVNRIVRRLKTLTGA